MAANKVKVEVTVQVPEGTSKTKVEKALSTLLKGGSTAVPEGFKIGAPKVVPAPTPAPASSETALA